MSLPEDRCIAVYYTCNPPHAQIELPSESVGLALISAAFDGALPDGLKSVELGINQFMKRSQSPDLDGYIATFTKRDRLSIGFRVRAIYAESVEAIAEEVASFLRNLAEKMDYENSRRRIRGKDYVVAVFQPSPAIAKYIIEGA